MISKQLTALFAIVAITVLGGLALAQGIDGAIFATVIAAIAGLGGYSIRNTKPPTP